MDNHRAPSRAPFGPIEISIFCYRKLQTERNFFRYKPSKQVISRQYIDKPLAGIANGGAGRGGTGRVRRCGALSASPPLPRRRRHSQRRGGAGRGGAGPALRGAVRLSSPLPSRRRRHSQRRGGAGRGGAAGRGAVRLSSSSTAYSRRRRHNQRRGGARGAERVRRCRALSAAAAVPPVMEAGARPAGRGAGAGRLWRPSFSLPPRAPHHPFLSPPARQSAVQGMVAPSAVVICFCRYTMTTTRSLRFPPIPSSPDCFQVCSLRGTILYSMHAFAPPSWDSSAHISLSPESSSKIASLQLDSLSL